MRIPDNPTPFTCFDEIRPLCDELLKLTRAAPLSDAARAGLSVLVATHCFGAAVADERRATGSTAPISVLARQLLEVIVEGLERGETPTLAAAQMPKSVPSLEQTQARCASSKKPSPPQTC